MVLFSRQVCISSPSYKTILLIQFSMEAHKPFSSSLRDHSPLSSTNQNQLGEIASDRDFAVSDLLKVMTATYVASADQSSKCMLGKNKSMVSFYESRIIVQFNAMPLIITAAAEPSANIGLLLQLETDLLAAVEPLRQQLLMIERENSANV